MQIDRRTLTDATPTEAQWQAILTRDRSIDGHFFYGVLSTRILCRPSCAARPARPESVVCHQTVEEARAVGFRPCLRCRPDRPETW